MSVMALGASHAGINSANQVHQCRMMKREMGDLSTAEYLYSLRARTMMAMSTGRGRQHAIGCAEEKEDALEAPQVA